MGPSAKYSRLSASLLSVNDDRDVYDVWLSHWLRIPNGPIGAPNVINISIVIEKKERDRKLALSTQMPKEINSKMFVSFRYSQGN